MRKKTITKIIACACVAAMAVGFGACKSKPKDPTTKAPETSATDAPTETTVGGETTAPVATQPGATTAPAAPGATGLVKPTDTASAVKMYNDAIAKKGAVSAIITRELVEGTAMGLSLDMLAPGAKDAFALNNAELAGADLFALDPASVASASATESGDNFVITFKLNDATLDQTGVSGANGFMYFLDAQTVIDTVVSIGKQIGGEGFVLEVNKETIVLELVGGTFTATINKTTGAISAASIGFSENVAAKLSKPIKATVKVTGKGTVDFSVA